jgi:DNA-binding XRE family transcriptional regulator
LQIEIQTFNLQGFERNLSLLFLLLKFHFLIFYSIFVTISLHFMFFEKLEGDILIELGERLKQLRKNKKYSQQVLADKIGISRRLLIDIEAGKGTSLLIFIKLLKEFKKTDKLLELLNSTSISPKEIYKKEHK